MKELTKAEEQVMQILWNKGKAFVKEIVEAYPDPKPAYTTVSTIVRILETKGIVTYETFGKSHCYIPVLSREEYTRQTAKGLISNYFNGSLAGLVSFFAKEEKLDTRELDEIVALVNQIKRKEHE